MKHLRRRVIIRQYDYHRVQNSALKVYNRTDFEPITLQELEHEHLLKVLSNVDLPVPPPYLDLTYPKTYLYRMQNYMYNKEYVNWFSEYDEDGYMWIQAKRNTPASMLGWATFEYDY